MLVAATKEHVRRLIDINDQINRLTSLEHDINTTKIVVIGDQSHGKSSVLEALSGVDLPRGEGIKTRVPLTMQLRKCDSSEAEHAMISRNGVEPRRIELSAIAASVEEFTADIAGDSKVVKDEPIDLKVFKHDQDDLTLIDLPGITRNAREGQGDSEQLEKLILDMSRRYCAPPETVILNVASAMVDFSNNASLQLSQKLDPDRRRTLLCVTKIDQHKEPGLAKNIGIAITSMKLKPELVFVVRNRKQQENEQEVSLGDARKLEDECIKSNDEIVRGSKTIGYGLGVRDLSKQLVDIQIERINETLPKNAKAIRSTLEQKSQRLAEIGEPLEDEFACRMAANKCVDQVVDQAQKEREGRVPHGAGQPTAEGEMFEMELPMDIQAERSKHPEIGFQLKSEPRILPDGSSCYLLAYPSGHDTKQGEPNGKILGAFLHCNCPSGATSMTLDYTLTLQGDEESLATKNITHVFTKSTGCGTSQFCDVSQLKGTVTLRASVYVEAVKLEEGGDTGKLFCETLNELGGQLRDEVDGAHPARIFFSKQFGRKLEAEAKRRRGSSSLPGAISQDVPVGVLQELRQKLPPIVKAHVDAVSEAASHKLQTIIETFVDAKAHPKLVTLLLSTAATVVKEQTKAAQRDTARLLQYEDAEVHTHNHYYMDIVQDLRKRILEKDDAEEVWSKLPDDLANLDFSSLKCKSNEEQEIVDMQIKTFAYWKLTKKRLVDYLVMATKCNLSKELFDRLKPAFMEAIEGAGEKRALMTPDPTLGRERRSLTERIAGLKEANALLVQLESETGMLTLDDDAVGKKSRNKPAAAAPPAPAPADAEEEESEEEDGEEEEEEEGEEEESEEEDGEDASPSPAPALTAVPSTPEFAFGAPTAATPSGAPATAAPFGKGKGKPAAAAGGFTFDKPTTAAPSVFGAVPAGAGNGEAAGFVWPQTSPSKPPGFGAAIKSAAVESPQ